MKLSKLKSCLFFTNCIIISIFYFSLTSCENDLNELKKIDELAKTNQEIGNEIELLYSDSGKIRARLNAPMMIRTEATDNELGYVEFPKGLKVIFYEADTISGTITADYGKNIEAKQQTDLNGNVIIINNENKKLETEILHWDQKNKTIFNEEPLKITTPTELLFGEGFYATQDLKYYKLKKLTGMVQLKQ